MTLLDALDLCSRGFGVPGPAGFILEKDRIRVLTRPQTAQFWADVWKEELKKK